MGKKVTPVILAAIVAFSLILTAGVLFAETKKSDAVETKTAETSDAVETKTPENKDVALVNGEPIPRSELDRAVALAVQRSQKMGQPMDPSQLTKIKEDILNRLIGGELLYQQSVKEGITVSEKELDEKFQQWKKGFPSEEEFKKSLTQWNVDEATMKRDLTKAMNIEAFVKKKFADKTTVPESEVKAYYEGNPQYFQKPEQVRASHILIKVAPDAKEEDKAAAMARIKDVQKKLKEGAKFDALAKEYSECPSKDKGGDLGYFGRGQMVKPFEEIAFSTKPGEVTDIVETQFGYHLIEVVDVQPATVVPFSEVQERIAKFLEQQKIQEEMFKYIEELKKSAKIETFLTSDSSK